jgi:hypothetical protein
MEATLFKQVGYSLSKLIEDIDIGEIGLPDMKEIQLFTSAMDAKGHTQAARAFGIDLGTTNSSVEEASWASGEKPVCRVLEID